MPTIFPVQQSREARNNRKLNMKENESDFNHNDHIKNSFDAADKNQLAFLLT